LQGLFFIPEYSKKKKTAPKRSGSLNSAEVEITSWPCSWQRQP
jgi:hypothetical protein